ncbi:MAG: potassium transporter TrkG [Pseudomonadota bacterium]
MADQADKDSAQDDALKPEASSVRDPVVRSKARARFAVLQMRPAKLLLMGYLSYIALGWVLLSLPFAQAQVIGSLDNLFIATSAVSTTGLVTVDPGSSYTFFGELVIILLIQIGGLGYMTLGSFIVLSVTSDMGRLREHATQKVFNLPDEISPRAFVVSVVIFTAAVQAVGALALWAMFRAEGVDNPLWSAIFHAVSAFCTAGFSLNSNSFEGFRDHVGINVVISALSILGAMGFLIVLDMARTLTGKARHLGFTSKVIVRITLSFLVVGTVLLFVTEPSLQALPPSERLMAAFFQVMTASTTVGFNTHPISALSSAVLIVMFFLMVIGASPAGTGGGLKTTSFAALVGLVRSTLKGRGRIRFFKREIPLARLQDAAAGFSYYMVLASVAAFLLFLTEAGAAFEVVLFEVLSAMGTVGLSMGLTGDLSDLGKLIVIVLMTAGRIGILTFGIALASHDESRDEEQDNELVT